MKLQILIYNTYFYLFICKKLNLIYNNLEFIKKNIYFEMKIQSNPMNNLREKYFYFFILLFSLIFQKSALAQADSTALKADSLKRVEATKEEEPAEEKAPNWEKSLSFGLNVSHTLNINAPSSGSPKSGFGSSNNIGFTLNYIKETSKFKMQNDASWTFAFYKAKKASPTQNTSDIVNFNHDFALAFKKGGDWNVNIIMNEETSGFNIYDENYLRDYNQLGAIQRFLNPYTVTINPGIKYQPTKQFGISLSPYAIQLRGVMDQTIADKDLHFQDIDDRIKADGHYKTSFSKTLGASTNIWYKLKVKKFLSLDYKLFLSSNYFENILKNGQMKGQFKTDINLFKGLLLTHIGNLKGNFANNPLKPFYNQVVLLGYSLNL